MKARPSPRRGAGLLLLPLLLAAPASYANLCELDPVPAATLLLPYFEVDLAPSATDDVIVTLNNAYFGPALSHVTFWTDWAQPSLDFDIFLTGYDVVTFSLRQAFILGNLPVTADQQSDPGNTISPSPFPAWDGSFASCQLFFPFYINPIIRGANLERLRDGHSGAPVSSIGERCLGANHGDQVARGYITFDSVSTCSTAFPFDTGYFIEGGLGVANNINTLWGDYLTFKPAQLDVEAHSLVHIEADASLASSTGYTFYGSLPSAAGGSDNREPLGSVWAAAIWNGDPTWVYTPALAATDLLVWRDPTAAPISPSGFVCGVGPDWVPLPQNTVYCLDEEENPVQICSGQDCFPLATQRVSTQTGAAASPYAAGFCRYDLGLEDEGPVSADVDFPGGIAQSHLATAVRYDTLSTVGLPALLLRGACAEASLTFLDIHLFRDGFESGNTSAWSLVIP